MVQVETQLNIAVVTVSDTRTEETDTSGNVLVEALLRVRAIPSIQRISSKMTFTI